MREALFAPVRSSACGNVGNSVPRKEFSKDVVNASHTGVFHSRHFHKRIPKYHQAVLSVIIPHVKQASSRATAITAMFRFDLNMIL